jgi:hypothetical protein
MALKSDTGNILKTKNFKGLSYNITGIPSTDAEYAEIAGKPDAACDRAVQAMIAHTFNAKARTEVVALVQKDLKDQGIKLPELDGDLSPSEVLDKYLKDGIITEESLLAYDGKINIEFTIGATRTGGLTKEWQKKADEALERYQGNVAELAGKLRAFFAKKKREFNFADDRDGIALALRKKADIDAEI